MNSNESFEERSRLLDLEERLMFQQRTIEQLNDVALNHQRRMDELTRQLARLADSLERLEDASPGGELPHEKPPHY